MQLGERRARDELGDEVDGLVVAAGLVQRDDRRVRQPRGGAAPRARRARRAAASCIGDALDRDGAVEALVVGQPDDAEAARAEAAHEPVAAEDAPRRRRGARRARRWRPWARRRSSPPPGFAAAACLLARAATLVRWRATASGPMGHTGRFASSDQEQSLSFFDEGDEPTRARRARARPRRPRRRRRRRRAGGRAPDRQTARAAPGASASASLVDPASCSSSASRAASTAARRTRCKDYNRDVTAVISDSDQPGRQAVLRAAGATARATRRTCRCRSTSCALAAERGRQARARLDVPGDMKAAQQQPRARARPARRGR